MLRMDKTLPSMMTIGKTYACHPAMSSGFAGGVAVA
jgi:hypothetical protein